MVLTDTRRHDHLRQLAPDHLRGVPAKRALRCRVEVRDPSTTVDADHAVKRRVQNRSVTLLACRELGRTRLGNLPLPPRLLGGAALTDVAERDREPVSGRGLDRRRGAGDRNHRSVPANPPILIDGERLSRLARTAERTVLDRIGRAVRVLVVHEPVTVLPHQFGRVVEAKYSHRSGVRERDHAVVSRDVDRLADRSEDRIALPLASPHHLGQVARQRSDDHISGQRNPAAGVRNGERPLWRQVKEVHREGAENARQNAQREPPPSGNDQHRGQVHDAYHQR